MAKPDDGGPAFPFVFKDLGAIGIPDVARKGMSLRDWFAGMAMTGNEALHCIHGDASDAGTAYYSIAKRAYIMADAMLEERASDPKTEGANHGQDSRN